MSDENTHKQPVDVTRDELYRQVWQTPMSRLALSECAPAREHYAAAINSLAGNDITRDVTKRGHLAATFRCLAAS